MAHTENTIQNRKNKHLSPFERGTMTQPGAGRKPYTAYLLKKGKLRCKIYLIEGKEHKSYLRN